MELSKLLDNIETKPRALLIIGPPSSGKSEWLESYIERNKLSEYINLSIHNYDTSLERSIFFESCLKEKRNFIYEGILLKEDRIKHLLDRIRNEGYKITLVHIKKKLETIIENNDLEKDKVIKLYNKSENIFNRFKDKVDRIIEVTNGS